MKGCQDLRGGDGLPTTTTGRVREATAERVRGHSVWHSPVSAQVDDGDAAAHAQGTIATDLRAWDSSSRLSMTRGAHRSSLG